MPCSATASDPLRGFSHPVVQVHKLFKTRIEGFSEPSDPYGCWFRLHRCIDAHAFMHYASDDSVTVVIRWDENAGLQAGCDKLPVITRSRRNTKGDRL